MQKVYQKQFQKLKATKQWTILISQSLIHGISFQLSNEI